MKAIEILAAAHDDRDACYDRLLWLLSEVVAGRIAMGRVTVDLQARTYSWVSEEEWLARLMEPRQRAGVMPSTNGHCDVAPLRVEGGIEGLRRLAEEAEEESQ